MRRKTTLASLAACFTVLAPQALAQRVLHFTDGWRTNPIGTAMVELGLDPRGVIDEQAFLDMLRSREWDLVIVRRYNPLGPSVRNFVLDELEAHVDNGGALMFSMAQLDEQPLLWPLLGIEGARDLVPPLSFIAGAHDAAHPATSGMAPDDFVPSTDYGDELVPGLESFALNVYFDLGTPAIVMSGTGRVIANGQEWDNWDVASGIDVARAQIEWLLGCPADLDGDGGTTVFDFLEFQNRFDSGGATGFADFYYDGRLDVFDFLEFLSLFEASC
jgi:hypothetical protein